MRLVCRAMISRVAIVTAFVSLTACSRVDLPAAPDAAPPADAAGSVRDAAIAVAADAAVDLPGTPARYRGKPMLVILESYALATIGEIDPDKNAKVRIAVQRSFGGDDDWRATVRKTMQWPDTIDAEIRANWDRFRAPAATKNVPADSAAFARSFADKVSTK